MKKIFSMMAAAVVCVLMSACSSEMDKHCGKIADAMIADNVEETATLTEQAYAKKGECSASNLADLSLAYNFLANKVTDNTTRYDYVQKVVDCYKSAVAKDANVAKKCYETAKVDMASITKQYEDMYPQYEAAIAAENAPAVDESAVEEGTEEVTEEAAE